MSRTYIIAEAGVNHNGSLDMAKELIDVAAEAGADAVKFQTFKADNLVNKSARKAEYQQRLTENQESQYEMLKKLELSVDMHLELEKHCRSKNIEFLSTPFDLESVDFLDKVMNVTLLKVSSGDITNGPLLVKMAKTQKPIILSTGMSSLGEVEEALAVLAYGYTSRKDRQPSIEDFRLAYGSVEGLKVLKEKVSLLHCTTEYPTPFDEVNLQVMGTLKQSFGLAVGLSDHTKGISIPVAAVARGAEIIEKHFTLNRQLPGPDHQASLDPAELKQMIQSIREVERALGETNKYPTISELKNKTVARKSLVAKKAIQKGEVFSEDNVTIKRPGNGLSPMQFWNLSGTIADRSYQQDELIVR